MFTAKFASFWFDQIFKKCNVLRFIKLAGWKTSNQNFKPPQEKIKKIQIQYIQINEHEIFLQQALVLVC